MSRMGMSGPVAAKFELFVGDPEPGTRFYQQLGFAVAHRKPDGTRPCRAVPS
jgi:hypothetical protein